MLFWIVLALVVISAIVITVTDSWWHVEGCVAATSCMTFIIFLAALIAMCVVLAVNYIGVDGDIEAFEKRYESLIYQYENNIYDNDNDLGKRELMVDIENWNCDLARKQKNQDNFWIGIFYPNIYNDFKFIEYWEGE